MFCAAAKCDGFIKLLIFRYETMLQAPHNVVQLAQTLSPYFVTRPMSAGTIVSNPISAGTVSNSLGKSALSAAEHLFEKGLFLPPGYHRAFNAAGLALGLFAGRQLMNIIVGHKPDGTPISKETVPFPLRPLHGIISYNPYSDQNYDRWMKVADSLAPALFGAIGAMAGSSYFFSRQIQSAHEVLKMGETDFHKVTLGRAEQALALEKSKPWWGAAGVTSIFGSASGLNPLYSFTLGMNFMMRSARKAFMGVPFMSWFSGTRANMPVGPIGVTREMLQYLTHNKAMTNPDAIQRFEQLASEMGHYWIKNTPEETVNKFVTQLIQEVKTKQAQIVEQSPGMHPTKVSESLLEWLFQGHLERVAVNTGIIKDINSTEEILSKIRLGDYGFAAMPAKHFESTRRNVTKIENAYAHGFAKRVTNARNAVGEVGL